MNFEIRKPAFGIKEIKERLLYKNARRIDEYQKLTDIFHAYNTSDNLIVRHIP